MHRTCCSTMLLEWMNGCTGAAGPKGSTLHAAGMKGSTGAAGPKGSTALLEWRGAQEQQVLKEALCCWNEGEHRFIRYRMQIKEEVQWGTQDPLLVYKAPTGCSQTTCSFKWKMTLPIWKGYGMEFTGSGSFINAGGRSELDFAGKSFSIECWFYAQQTDKTATLVFKGESEHNAQYGIGIGTLVWLLAM